MRPVRRARKSQSVTVPAPVGGLNGRDSLASMEPTDAFVLDNIFPNNTSCDTRRGSRTVAQGFGGAVETLAVYAGGTSPQLLAFANGGVFNITTLNSTTGTQIKSGRTNNRVNTAMFSNAGAQFLMGVNGVDNPFAWNGAAWTDLVITGITGAGQNSLSNIFAFKGRVYLTQTGMLGFYYLAVGAIQGAASYFDLSQVAMRGGSLLGMASFSTDTGNGPNDFIVFITSEGEYIVYQGTDPANAATFSLVGRYYSSAPVGSKGWFNFRSDLFVICDEGIVAFSQIRSMGDAGKDVEYISSKLGAYYRNQTIYRDVYGWQGVQYAKSNMLVVNCPNTSNTAGAYIQFVMNTDTNAWCRFTGLNGVTWATFNRSLYFGTSDGRVLQADVDSVYSDAGSAILCEARPAFNYFDDGNGAGAVDKHFHFGSFIIQNDGEPNLAVQLDVNFEDDRPGFDYSTTLNTGQWDISSWDVDYWAGYSTPGTETVPFGKMGYCASPWLRLVINGTALKWFATRFIFERSGGINL